MRDSVLLQQIVNGLTLGAVYTLIALSFSLVMGILGILNLAIAELFMDQKVVDYIVDAVRATREPQNVGLAELKPLIAFGASPRASIYLAQAARAHAYLRGRAFVVPEDVKAMAFDVLRHRVLLTFEAEAEDMDADQVITKILEAVGVP